LRHPVIKSLLIGIKINIVIITYVKSVPRYVEPESNNEQTIREQHFYREGNAEVLQLVTRGQVEDTSHHYPTAFIVDGKDVLLQRFMQDQKARQELSMQEPEVVRTIESHQRPMNLYQRQQEILLLPDELEIRHRHAEGSGSNLQKLEMDDGYAAQKMDAESQMREARRQEVTINVPERSSTERISLIKDQKQTTQSYTFHDLELARQNVLLTRLLLERESRQIAGTTMDAASYLETQSLPGQVAIATQTDRVAATQTERHVRSRSDNDESDEDTRSRKKMKPKKRHDGNELKRTRALWMKSPIEEEEGPCFDKRLSILRRKVKEVKEGRKVSLEPEVLREISDSLDENAGPCREREGKSTKSCQQAIEDSNIGYKVLSEEKNGSTSSTETGKQQHEKTSDEKRAESFSSPEISVDNGKYVCETMEERSSRKESRTKKQKKVESVIKPSFRVLEREITMLTKKLSKLADKKVQQTTGDKSQKRSKVPGDPKSSKKDTNQGTSRKTEDSRKHGRSEISSNASRQVKRDKFKYQQRQVTSPDSSEYEDAPDKPKKSKFRFRQESTKQKQSSSQKVKKQAPVHVGSKEPKKQDLELEKRKDAASKESSKPEAKIEKTAKLSSRTQKLAAIGRRENVSEEPGTSTGSDQMSGQKNVFGDVRDSDKKSTESSEIPLNHADQRIPKQKLDRVSERFSDDFVTDSQREDIDQPTAFYLLDTSTHKRDLVVPDMEKIQQFSDNFTMDTQTGEHLKSLVTEDEIEQNTIRDSDKEHTTLREAAEDVAALQDLEHARSKTKEMDSTKKEQSDLLEASDIRVSDDSSRKMSPSDSAVFKTSEEHRIERSPLHATIKDDISHISEKHEEKSKNVQEVAKEIAEEDKITIEKHIDELKTPEDAEEFASGKVDVLEHTESSKVSSGAAKRVEREEEYKENGLHSDSASPTETKKDRKNIEDVTLLSHSAATAELCEAESGEREQSGELNHESQERSEKETPLIESTRGMEQEVAEESVQRETEYAALHEIKSDVKGEVQVTTVDRHEDVGEKSKEIPEEHVTQKSEEFERTEEEKVKSTTEAFEEPSDDQPVKVDVSSDGILRALLIDEDDKILRYIDESSPEASRDDLIQPKSSDTIDITQEDTDMEKSERQDDDVTPKKGIESESKSEEACELDFRQTESQKTEEDQTAAHSTETTTSEKVADEGQLPIEHEETKEELSATKHREQTEETAIVEERTGEEVKEIKEVKEMIEEFSTDQSSRDSDLVKPEISERDREDKMVIESADIAEPPDKEQGRADVSVPIFSSFIDTFDVSEDSDSSSDVSRKTTLTPRPYDTPRHRQKWQQQENLEIAGMPGISKDAEDDGAKVESESEEDNLSFDEIQNGEDPIEATIEAVINKPNEDIDTVATCEKVLPNIEDILPVPDLQKVHDRDGDVKSKETNVELKTDTKPDVKDALTTIRDNILTIAHTKQLNDTSREDVKDENTASEYCLRENGEDKSETIRRETEKVSESTEQDDKSKIRSPSERAEQIHSMKDKAVSVATERDETRSKGSKVNKNGTKDTATGKTRSKDGAPSTSGKPLAKAESSKSSARRKQKPERSGMSSPAEKKLDDDEKATPSRSRARIRKPVDGASQKQSRREGEVQRRPTLSRSKARTERKPAISPRAAEIDVSKTQSKYMAWYNNKREETESKRAHRKVTEDEEQLPRWVSRGLRHQTAKKEPKERREQAEHRTPEMTLRSRRRVKPLVNVESEQLKAIVRQGRRLRKAEGSLKKDPSVEIFARTPPISFADTQHRLLQHSEYKYERIPPPFYLHPPPAPHPSPQLSPDRSFEELQPSTSQHGQFEDERSSNSVPAYQGVDTPRRLRHQQLLEKKSVFDIAYSEAAPSQLRSDSATPPS